MRNLKILTLILLSIFSLKVEAQESSDWVKILDNELTNRPADGRKGREVNTLSRIMKASKNGNSFTFMYLGPLLDAFNNLYEGTNDEKYLQYGYEVVKNIVNSAKASKGNKPFKTWYVSTNQKRYSGANNKEWMLFEGHLFRYVVQYLYLVNENSEKIKNSDILQDNPDLIDFVHKNVWKKWHDASIRTRGDVTLLYGVRVHNGAHWATIAKYLERLVEGQKERDEFVSFYSGYDSWLKKNITIDSGCYLWNGTWDTPFLKAHQDRIAKGLDQKRIQDTAHGNHVVQYIIASYRIRNGWAKEDLNYLANTLLNRIVDKENDLCSESINGEGEKKYIDLSDGWLKLGLYNSDVRQYFLTFYKGNKSRISSSHQNLQFYSIATRF